MIESTVLLNSLVSNVNLQINLQAPYVWVEVICCEQPGGGIECRTVTPRDHKECEVVEGIDGLPEIKCTPGLTVDDIGTPQGPNGVPAVEEK